MVHTDNFVRCVVSLNGRVPCVVLYNDVDSVLVAARAVFSLVTKQSTLGPYMSP